MRRRRRKKHKNPRFEVSLGPFQPGGCAPLLATRHTPIDRTHREVELDPNWKASRHHYEAGEGNKDRVPLRRQECRVFRAPSLSSRSPPLEAKRMSLGRGKAETSVVGVGDFTDRPTSHHRDEKSASKQAHFTG